MHRRKIQAKNDADTIINYNTLRGYNYLTIFCQLTAIG